METRYQQLDGQRFDIGTSTIYVGYAQLTSTPDPAKAQWTIKKISLDASGNPTQVQWSAETAAVWDNRASETYT